MGRRAMCGEPIEADNYRDFSCVRCRLPCATHQPITCVHIDRIIAHFHILSALKFDVVGCRPIEDKLKHHCYSHDFKVFRGRRIFFVLASAAIVVCVLGGALLLFASQV